MESSSDLLSRLSVAIANLHTQSPTEDVLPAEQALTLARQKLLKSLPVQGRGLERTIDHLQNDIVPGLNASSRSSRYYGFVTGGSTPAASLADNLVTTYDQNVQVHLPQETVATDVEDRALSMLCELLRLDPSQWPHRVFTTGATASNILGLACGREYAITEASAVRSDPPLSVGDIGIYEAMHRAGIDRIQILTTVPHSSLSKAASILGLGRASVKSIGLADAPHKFDIAQLKKLLETPGTASIVAISASEVNTGFFATSGMNEMQEIRSLCDTYGAWIHVDGAFGIMGRLLTAHEHQTIINGCEGLELADSITGDSHKLLNVPYDCGFFLCRHRDIASNVFQNPNAAYLSASPGSIMSPLNIGIENSRRFRALPVYASLTAYGIEGYRRMLEKQVALSRRVAEFLLESSDFELLPKEEGSKDEILSKVFMIVLFRAKDDGMNKVLVDKIKASRKIYVSGTAWEGKPACRIAVSNWMADVEKDLPVIKQVLTHVVTSWYSK
ncbi:pyridoxal-dependent decarboxylase [Westerdykella ornata]|uniref:Pyridoxal-dependent decarboxylase n=1 Tax=Westerdykella ornata TaxID=318751 RepID=A0A6A6JR00_WESOR|nr:pyridoxal-dependent decarboxylase [Westerdykella ornata]KAF2278523.1 pyridoxal-dependent decarboxylase [Westerdykella ornata]